MLDLRIGPVAKRLGDARCGCSPTTARSPARSCGCSRARSRRQRRPTTATSRPRCTGTGCGWTTATTATHETQAPIPVGGRFTYRIEFPDPGVYWYHPHIREDYGQEMGLYGNILVAPADPDYWPPAHRELVLTLDDVLIEDGQIAPFSRRDQLRRDGPLRQRPADQRRDRTWR